MFGSRDQEIGCLDPPRPRKIGLSATGAVCISIALRPGTAHVLMDEIALRLEIRGLVQGVGYRWSMVEEARRQGVRGWVRNRHDGTVEATVIGSPEAVDRIVAWARRGPRSSVVEAVDVFAGEGAFDSFDPRPTE
jgi:acylphosphatase